MPWRHRRRWRAGILIGLLAWGFLREVPAVAGPQVRAAEGAGPVLVMPFEPADGHAQAYWLQEAAAILLSDSLRASGVRAYTRDERVRAFEQLHLPLRVSLSHATVIRVGQLLGASDVVRGTLAIEGSMLTVRVRQVKLDTGRLLPEIVERAPLFDLFGLFARVAGRVAPGGSAPPAEPPPPFEAFENYVKGVIADAPSSQIQFLEAALKVRADYDEARIALWEALTGVGQHEKAIEVVEAVGGRSSRARLARFLAALSRIRLAAYDEAVEQLRDLLDVQPLAAIYNNMGIIQLRRGATPQTGVPTYYLTKAVEAAPDDQDSYFNLGYAYWLEGDPKGALYWLREAVRRDPADSDAHLVLAAVLRALDPSSPEAAREEDLARQLSETSAEWLDRRPGSTSALPPRLERLKLDLDPVLAARVDIAIGSTVQREQREVATFHLERGRRFFAEEKDREAIEELRRAVFLVPYDAETQLLLGRIYLRGGRLAEAVDALTIAAWSEETAEARVALAEAYLRSGDAVAAQASAERALELDPTSSEAKAMLERITKPEDVDRPDPVG